MNLNIIYQTIIIYYVLQIKQIINNEIKNMYDVGTLITYFIQN